MILTIDEVRHIANLARLELTEDELNEYCDQLSAILEHFQNLQQVDTSAVHHTSLNSNQPGSLRQDEVIPGLSLNQLLANAPDIDADQFSVPPVFE